jgi:hypothetical protein
MSSVIGSPVGSLRIDTVRKFISRASYTVSRPSRVSPMPVISLIASVA